MGLRVSSDSVQTWSTIMIILNVSNLQQCLMALQIPTKISGKRYFLTKGSKKE